jgi:hypothetical protein
MSKPMYYTLDDNKNPVPVDDVLVWANMLEDPKIKVVAYDEINGHRVSTVFLGLDHRFGEGDPLLFETMVFSDDADYNEFQDRYTTWDEAYRGHIFVLNMIKMGQPINNRKILKIKL